MITLDSGLERKKERKKESNILFTLRGCWGLARKDEMDQRTDKLKKCYSQHWCVSYLGFQDDPFTFPDGWKVIQSDQEKLGHCDPHKQQLN